MSLQNIMNVLRDEKKSAYNQTREQNREEFKNSAPSNKKLLVTLSQIKDYMGFWLKSGLNDFAKEDPIIKQMILEISNSNLKNFMNDQTQEFWNSFRPGLEIYAQKDISKLYKRSIHTIVNGLSAMAKEKVIKRPSKLDFPLFNNEGQNPTRLIDYKNGAPFMARPDTFVGLSEGYLIEIRGLNKAVGQNNFMRGFQMPYYRIFETLANINSPDIYDPIPMIKSDKNENPQQKRLDQFTKPMNHIELTNPKTERKDTPKSSAQKENKNEIKKDPIIRKRG